MREIKKHISKKGAFTIIELLTVMSIIVILIGLLVPSLNAAKRYAKTLRQRAQLAGIEGALELFQAEHGSYPESGALDEDNKNYCGAMKLAEAMVGLDFLGFHPDSKFRQDGTLDGTAATQLYPLKSSLSDTDYAKNLKLRTGPYLSPDNADAYPLTYLYSNTGPFDPCSLVLCDVYGNVKNRGSTGPSKIGMPILYYKADISKTQHDTKNPDNTDNIYSYKDNDELVHLGLPFNPAYTHVIDSTPGGRPTVIPGLTPRAEEFYIITQNPQVTTTERPYRSESYILMSAGFDGVYGTSDDICNFKK